MGLHFTYMVLRRREVGRVPVYDDAGKASGEIELPPVFGFPLRKDIVLRAYLSAFTARLQPQGRDPLAGKRTTARSFGVGLGIARVPRIPGIGRAAFIGSAVGGMATHPPRVEKRIHEEVNKKERLCAIASAIAATASPELVRSRGHRFTVEKLPVALLDDVEGKIAKTRDARELMMKIGIWEDVVRAARGTRIRAGKGKMRGRRYKEPKSVLFVLTSRKSPLALAVRNLPGVDVATPHDLSILHLAPGGVPGRLTVYTVSALEQLGKKFEVKVP